MSQHRRLSPPAPPCSQRHVEFCLSARKCSDSLSEFFSLLFDCSPIPLCSLNVSAYMSQHQRLHVSTPALTCLSASAYISKRMLLSCVSFFILYISSFCFLVKLYFPFVFHYRKSRFHISCFEKLGLLVAAVKS